MAEEPEPCAPMPAEGGTPRTPGGSVPSLSAGSEGPPRNPEGSPHISGSPPSPPKADLGALRAALEAALTRDPGEATPAELSPILGLPRPPQDKCRHLDGARLLRDNLSLAAGGRAQGVGGLRTALSILEKYGRNLLQARPPRHWRSVRFGNPVFRGTVDAVQGGRGVLRLLGYTEETGEGLSFPPGVGAPHIPRVAAVTADVLVLRAELDLLLANQHPNPQFFTEILAGGAEGPLVADSLPIPDGDGPAGSAPHPPQRPPSPTEPPQNEEGGGWACASCTFLNPSPSVLCGVCERPRLARRPPPDPPSWQCPHCTFRNRGSGGVCDVCHRSGRDSPTPRPPPRIMEGPPPIPPPAPPPPALSPSQEAERRRQERLRQEGQRVVALVRAAEAQGVPAEAVPARGRASLGTGPRPPPAGAGGGAGSPAETAAGAVVAGLRGAGGGGGGAVPERGGRVGGAGGPAAGAAPALPEPPLGPPAAPPGLRLPRPAGGGAAGAGDAGRGELGPGHAGGDAGAGAGAGPGPAPPPAGAGGGRGGLPRPPRPAAPPALRVRRLRGGAAPRPDAVAGGVRVRAVPRVLPPALHHRREGAPGGGAGVPRLRPPRPGRRRPEPLLLLHAGRAAAAVPGPAHVPALRPEADGAGAAAGPPVPVVRPVLVRVHPGGGAGPRPVPPVPGALLPPLPAPVGPPTRVSLLRRVRGLARGPRPPSAARGAGGLPAGARHRLSPVRAVVRAGARRVPPLPVLPVPAPVLQRLLRPLPQQGLLPRPQLPPPGVPARAPPPRLHLLPARLGPRPAPAAAAGGRRPLRHGAAGRFPARTRRGLWGAGAEGDGGRDEGRALRQGDAPGARGALPGPLRRVPDPPHQPARPGPGGAVRRGGAAGGGRAAPAGGAAPARARRARGGVRRAPAAAAGAGRAAAAPPRALTSARTPRRAGHAPRVGPLGRRAPSIDVSHAPHGVPRRRCRGATPPDKR